MTQVKGDNGSLSLSTGDQVRSPSTLSSTVDIPLSPEKAIPETASGPGGWFDPCSGATILDIVLMMGLSVRPRLSQYQNAVGLKQAQDYLYALEDTKEAADAFD